MIARIEKGQTSILNYENLSFESCEKIMKTQKVQKVKFNLRIKT